MNRYSCEEFSLPPAPRRERARKNIELPTLRAYLLTMRRALLACFLCCFALTSTAGAATGRIMKVLPHFLDLEGRHSVSPSLYDRDAYQAYLRDHPAQRSGIRFDIHWLTKGQPAAPLKLRVELRGIAEGNSLKQLVIEEPVKPAGWFGHWTSLTLKGEAYKSFGEITAWRVTLWENDQLLAEQKSFLW